MTDISHKVGPTASTGGLASEQNNRVCDTPFDFNKPAHKHREDSNGIPWGAILFRARKRKAHYPGN